MRYSVADPAVPSLYLAHSSKLMITHRRRVGKADRIERESECWTNDRCVYVADDNFFPASNFHTQQIVNRLHCIWCAGPLIAVWWLWLWVNYYRRWFFVSFSFTHSHGIDGGEWIWIYDLFNHSDRCVSLDMHLTLSMRDVFVDDLFAMYFKWHIRVFLFLFCWSKLKILCH